MHKLARSQSQRGDTIVEVLLAMAVLGMVLGTSFGIVNRSLATGRDAQERSEATKLTESQIEKLKTASSDSANGYFELAENTIYCVTDTLERIDINTTGVIDDAVDIATYPDECKAGPDGRYRMSIIRADNVFTVRTRWNSIRGGKLNESKMVYRTYAYSLQDYPSVSTVSTAQSSNNTINVNGNLLDSGKTAVIERGFILNTSPGQHPKSQTSVWKQVIGNGTFTVTFNQLTPGTDYYIRAYATNDSGTSYGNEIKFTTVPGGQGP